MTGLAYFVSDGLYFIPEEWNDGGYNGGVWPPSAVLLTEEECATYWKQNAPTDMEIGSLDGRPCWVARAFSEDQLLSMQNAILQTCTQLSSSQKIALTNRVGTLQDAVDLEMATPGEVAELAARQEQLLNWRRYAVFLGRVTSQAGWHGAVDWPAQPTEGMDLAVSAVAPKSQQTQ